MTRRVYDEVRRDEVHDDGVDTHSAADNDRELRTRAEVEQRRPLNAYPSAPPRQTVVRERTTTSEVEYSQSEYLVGKTVQVLNYLLSIIEGLLALRVVLQLIGANATAPIAQIIYGLTNPLVALFANLVPNPVLAGTNVTIEITTLLAMLFWALLFYAASRLLRLLITPPER